DKCADVRIADGRSEQAELVEEEERPVTRSKGIQPPQTPQPRGTSPDNMQHETMYRMTPSKQGDNWQSTWHTIAEKLSPETKKNVLKVLTRTFSHAGANDALDMAESIIDDHIKMDLVKSVASDSQIRHSNSPATTTVLRCKTLWEEEKPKLLLKAQHLHNYLLLATEFKNLQTQALSPDTPFGQLFLKDRGKKAKRTTNERTAAKFVLDHMVSLMYPQIATEGQSNEDEKTKKERKQKQAQREKEAKDRLTRDRDMANNITCFVEPVQFGMSDTSYDSIEFMEKSLQDTSVLNSNKPLGIQLDAPDEINKGIQGCRKPKSQIRTEKRSRHLIRCLKP
ncbi:hypothetical protein KCU91_g15819, partial [Aureobasidium melanogenum]